MIAISGAVIGVYQHYKKLPLTELLNQLTDKSLSREQHQKILRKMNRRLEKYSIKDDYIHNFVLNDRGKETLFADICESNNIEPTEEICKKFLNADMKKIRADYYNKRKNGNLLENKPLEKLEPDNSISSKKGQTVYMSELLMDKFPTTCKKLIRILEKYNVNYSFIKGTKDIWCRDYMPIQTESGKFIQFKYDPSYLKGKKEWEDSRSDVKEVCRLNGIKATFSDINLDGGNVLICEGRAILSDRIFSENPIYEKETLVNELSKLLECEIIIIPAQNSDFTGHADGMVRFVNRNTILGNDRAKEYQYWLKGIQKVIDQYKLTYIDIPFFESNDPKHPYSAIGIYVNYLEVNNIIVMPVFGRDEDNQVVEILHKSFPNKQIETINYDEIAKEGGLLNCTTWVVSN